jgi:hypothetical protein
VIRSAGPPVFRLGFDVVGDFVIEFVIEFSPIKG